MHLSNLFQYLRINKPIYIQLFVNDLFILLLLLYFNCAITAFVRSGAISISTSL